MNPSPSDTKRRLVPRWRSLSTTLLSRELGSPLTAGAKAERGQAISPDLLTRLEKWRLSPSLITAAELVEVCIVEGREREAVHAARRLVSIDKNAAPLIREQAALLLTRLGYANEVPAGLSVSQPRRRSPRHLTRIHPHDPLAWVELALEQTTRGSPIAAERSMLIALGLAPHNRHVLRSAARLFLHRDDAEHALAIIARNAATRTDPWLIASEISLAQLVGRPARFLKTGGHMLADAGLPPRQITELAGAVATEELINGNRKKSKRCFVQSLIDPTGSALAQGEWATSSLGADLVSEDRITSTMENDEARAFHLFRLKRFADVQEACERWSENDTFSIRPFEFGAATAGYIENFEVSLKFARDGLAIRPSFPALLNARAFAAASLDLVEEAEDAINKIVISDTSKVQQLVAIANRGLLAFRKGDVAAGRKLYLESIDGFRRDGAPELAARAKVYLAREAMRIGADDWKPLLKDAQDAMSKFKDSEATISLRLVEKRAEAIMSGDNTKSRKDEVVEPEQQNISLTVKFGKNLLG